MNKKAFTLVEIMVVAVIFSFLAVGLITGFVSGAKVWKHAQDLGRNFGDSVIFVEKFSRELRKGLMFQEIGFEGSAQEFSFAVNSDGVFYKAIYKFDPDGKNFICRKIKASDIFADKEDEYEETSISSLEALSLQYYYFDVEKGGIWKDSWNKNFGPFRLIKLDFKLNGQEFSKIIFNPVS